MLRKTVLAIAAAAALAATMAPTTASAGGFNLHIGGPGFGYGHGYGHGYGYGPSYGYGPAYYGSDCYYKKVKTWSHKYDKWIWKTKKFCY